MQLIYFNSVFIHLCLLFVAQGVKDSREIINECSDLLTANSITHTVVKFPLVKKMESFYAAAGFCHQSKNSYVDLNTSQSLELLKFIYDNGYFTTQKNSFWQKSEWEDIQDKLAPRLNLFKKLLDNIGMSITVANVRTLHEAFPKS